MHNAEIVVAPSIKTEGKHYQLGLEWYSAKLAIDADPLDDEMLKKCKELERICFSSKDYEEGRLAFSEKIVLHLLTGKSI